MNAETRGDKALRLVIYLILFFVLLVSVIPLLYVLNASFSDSRLVLQGQVLFYPKGVTLEAYKRVFGNSEIVRGFFNSVVYTVLGTLLNVVLTVMGAYPLSRRDFKGRKILTLYFSFTMFFSGGLIPTYLLMSDLNLVNTLWAMILPGAVSVWNMIIVRTYFQNSIPYELQEAAFIDGCSNLGILRRIVLPLSAPVIAIITLFYAVNHWNSYFGGLIYLTDSGKFPLQLVLRSIIIQNDVQAMMESASETLAEQQRIGEGIKYAAIVVASLPLLVLFPFIKKHFEKGMMIGAIKG